MPMKSLLKMNGAVARFIGSIMQFLRGRGGPRREFCGNSNCSARQVPRTVSPRLESAADLPACAGFDNLLL
jgi:hypothetical protein